MKKTLILILLSIFFVGLSLKADDPCEVSGEGCASWWSGIVSFFWTDPGTGCELQIGYQVRECNGKVYVQFENFKWEECPTCTACQNFTNEIFPFGIHSADPEKVAEKWLVAFEDFAKIYFNFKKNQEPNVYNCPNSYEIINITPGGCGALFVAQKPFGTHGNYIYHLKYAACEENGCCVSTLEYCWDDEIVEVSSSFTQYSDENCWETTPLYDPFENYGEEWQFFHYPCHLTCWD